MAKVGPVLLVGFAGLLVWGAFASKNRDKCDDKIGAFVMSQSFVKDRLKAPSTASFPYITDDGVSVTKQEGCSYSVRAYVDAQNSFGAKIRTRYSVNVRPGDGDNWYATNLKM